MTECTEDTDTDLETDPLRLIAEYGDLAQRGAADAALWAGGGTLFDSKRTALYSALAERLRDVDKTLSSDKKLEMAAKAQPEFQQFIADGEVSATRYHTTQARLKTIEMLLEYQKALEYRTGREAGLTR